MGLLHKHSPKKVLISICTLAKKNPLKYFPIKRQRINLFRCCYISLSLDLKLYRYIQLYNITHRITYFFFFSLKSEVFQSRQIGVGIIVSYEFSDGV